MFLLIKKMNNNNLIFVMSQSWDIMENGFSLGNRFLTSRIFQKTCNFWDPQIFLEIRKDLFTSTSYWTSLVMRNSDLELVVTLLPSTDKSSVKKLSYFSKDFFLLAFIPAFHELRRKGFLSSQYHPFYKRLFCLIISCLSPSYHQLS